MIFYSICVENVLMVVQHIFQEIRKLVLYAHLVIKCIWKKIKVSFCSAKKLDTLDPFTTICVQNYQKLIVFLDINQMRICVIYANRLKQN